MLQHTITWIGLIGLKRKNCLVSRISTSFDHGVELTKLDSAMICLEGTQGKGSDSPSCIMLWHLVKSLPSLLSVSPLSTANLKFFHDFFGFPEKFPTKFKLNRNPGKMCLSVLLVSQSRLEIRMSIRLQNSGLKVAKSLVFVPKQQ